MLVCVLVLLLHKYLQHILQFAPSGTVTFDYIETSIHNLQPIETGRRRRLRLLLKYIRQGGHIEQ